MQKNMLAEKQEYVAIDVLRLVLSIGVVALHLSPLEELSPTLDFWVVNIATRVAVPFFFVVSGYFAAAKLSDGRRVWAQIKRLLLFYLVYNLFYIPQCVYYWWYTGRTVENAKAYLYPFFIKGLSDHLWFFLGVASGLLFLYLLKKILPDKWLFGLCAVVYFGAMLLDSFYLAVSQLPVLGKMLDYYYKYFFTLRNGFFFGLPMVALGYAIYTYRAKIPCKKWYFAAFAASFVLMNIEGYLNTGEGYAAYDLYWSFPLVVSFLFLSIASVQIDAKWVSVGRMLRAMSAIVYGLHLAVYFALVLFWNYYLGYSWSRAETFWVVSFLSLAVSWVILKLSKFKLFAWLRCFY